MRIIINADDCGISKNVNNKNICCIFNIGPHYREPIYSAIANEFSPHFYFGDKVSTDIKKMDYNKLPGFQKELKYINLYGGFYWQKGSVSLAWKEYSTYIVTGEPFCLSTWILAFICKMKGKKIIAWTHGWYGKEHGIKKIIKKSFLKLFSHILTYNKYSLELMKQQGFDPKKMSCIANSLNYDKQKKIREIVKKTNIYSSHFGNDHPVILYCGRIQKVKRLEILINCGKELLNKNIECNIAIVGKDIDNVDIKSMAKEAGIENYVWEYGPCYEEEKLGELFYNATVCVSPGNVGLTSIHSLTYGCPVITHNNFPMQMPEFEAIQDGVTGSFFKENDMEDLISKIELWIKKDDKEREEARNSAYNEIDRKWNINYQIKTIKNVLEL